MPNDFFHFKRFSIYQNRCAMKVGTDGVLLGAWTACSNATRILDIGTGTGLIALMLAQRCNAIIDAVEIDPEAARQANENIDASPWAERVTVINKSFQSFAGIVESYDLIVANPPYFNNSLPSPGHQRSLARHNNELRIPELMSGVSRLLAPRGQFGIVYPESDFKRVEAAASAVNLYPVRILNVIPTPGKSVRRILAEFSDIPQQTHKSELILEKYGRHKYSEEYKALTKDFYLE